MKMNRVSWQARILRLIMRLFFKPMLRFCSIGFMRSYMNFIDRLVGWLSPPESSPDFELSTTAHGERLIPIKEHDATRVLLYLPGGGFLTRSPNIHRLLVERICRAAGVTRADIVHYRLAPEHHLCASLEDSVAAYRSLLEEGIRPEQIIIAGDSAGGCLTLSTVLRLREFGEPLPAGLITLSPVTDLTFSRASRRINRKSDPVISAGRTFADSNAFAGDQDPASPLISPLFGDYRGMPPILMQVGSDEVLLDDTLDLAERVGQAGVSYELEVWEKMPHVWQISPFLPESRAAVETIGAFIRNRITA